jgi:Uma2 family endonuclease
MQSALRQRMSVEQFEQGYYGKRAELWRGEVREYMPTGPKHGKVTARLTISLGSYLLATGEGDLFAAETGFIIRTPQGESVLAPDIAFIRRERLPDGEFPPGFCSIVPDLVVEVVSPRDSYADVQAKAREWLAGGVAVVWIVDPQRRVVEVLQSENERQLLGEGEILTGAPVLPNFQISVRALFE